MVWRKLSFLNSLLLVQIRISLQVVEIYISISKATKTFSYIVDIYDSQPVVVVALVRQSVFDVPIVINGHGR